MAFQLPTIPGIPQGDAVHNSLGTSSSLKNSQFSNITKSTNAQCKVIIFPWKYGLGKPNISDALLAQASRLDISSQITHCNFTKNMGQAAGSFTIGLTSSPGIGTQDWKDIIKRGYWCLIYMANDGGLKLNPRVGGNLAKSKHNEAKYLRCMGYIETVGVKGVTEDNKAIDLQYEVTGRDFGIVYEETNIWHNLFKFDQIMLQNVKTNQLNVIGNVRIHTAIKLIHDLFYYPPNIPGAKVDDHKSLVDIGLQWLLPREMLQDIGFNLTRLSKGTYWGNLPGVADINRAGYGDYGKGPGAIFQTLAGVAVSDPTSYLSGNAWEQLKKISIPQLHELFCETTDLGLPRLIFRPIPWGISQKNYPRNAKYITKYINLRQIVKIPGADLMDFDLKEDDHSRYNSFLATVATTLINTEDNIGILSQTEFPKHNRASIRRHGFRPMHVTVDSLVKNEELANGNANFEQVKEYNYVMYDYWNSAVFAETGTVDIVGNNGVKIGKCMKFDTDVPYMNSKRYYIESYTDTFIVEDTAACSWYQNVSLTRGFEEADLRKGTGFGSRNTAFTAPGEYTKRNSSGDE